MTDLREKFGKFLLGRRSSVPSQNQNQNQNQSQSQSQNQNQNQNQNQTPSFPSPSPSQSQSQSQSPSQAQPRSQTSSHPGRSSSVASTLSRSSRASPTAPTSTPNLRLNLPRLDSNPLLPPSSPASPSDDIRRPSYPSEPPSSFSPRDPVRSRVNPILTVQQPTPPRIQSPPSNITTFPPNSPSPRTRPLGPPTPISGSNSPTRPSFETVFQAGAPLPSPGRSRAVDTPPTVAEEFAGGSGPQDYFGRAGQVAEQRVEPALQLALQPAPLPTLPKMGRRKIWIKRAGASPTLVQVTDDDLVDDVRDMVLRKYANSLGRSWDAPDVTVRLIPRERSQAERVLGPEEPICGLIDACFPGGQLVEEALLIDVPRKRTPLPSPRMQLYSHAYHNSQYEDMRPMENGSDYFPPMPTGSPHLSQSGSDPRHSLPQATTHSIGILENGQLPVLPSPGGRRSHARPKAHRQHTSSPTTLSAASLANITTSHHIARQGYFRMGSEPRPIGRTSAPLPPPLPDALGADIIPGSLAAKPATPPLEHVVSPTGRAKKHKKRASLAAVAVDNEERRPSNPHPQVLSVIEATVPPINVLIVEDNPINLRLLEMFTKRLKVRWSTAMNGRDAVLKWRTGGFHLVLMDIQLPIMSGLEATKEIRRLERVNGIGVFAKGDDEDRTPAPRLDREDSVNSVNSVESAGEDDKLVSGGLFKSPVIIVALTASSLQSDRHGALAAGCNDFLTKPVHFPWLERKVMEWGCMQALIDYEGFRKWKDLAAVAAEESKKEEELNPAMKQKREKREAKRAAIQARMGQAGAVGPGGG